MDRLLVPVWTVFRVRDFRALLVCNALLGLTYSFVAPFLSMWGTLEVGMSPVRFGVFMTITSAVAIAVSSWLARWSDTRYSRKAMLVIGGATGVLGYVGYAFVRDFVWLTLIGSFLLGFSSITFSQLFALVRDVVSASDEVPAHELPLYVNVFRLFFALSWTVGPALAAWVMHAYSFEGTFLVAALCFLLFTLFVQFAVRSVPPTAATRAAALALPLRVALLRPVVLAHFVGFALFFACSTMGMMNLPLLILNTLGGAEHQVGIAYGVAPVFELPFLFYLGLLATRIDHALMIRASLVLAIVYYGLLAQVVAPWHVYVLQVLSAAIVAVTSGVAITFFQNFLPEQAGTATNLYSNATRIGATGGYLLFGYLVAEGGHRTVFVVCALFCALALLLLLAFRPRRSTADRRQDLGGTVGALVHGEELRDLGRVEARDLGDPAR